MDAMVKPWHDDTISTDSGSTAGDRMTRIDAPVAPPAGRFPQLDLARGIAVVAMVIYHLSWDLRYFSFITADVEEGLGWRAFARAIAGGFLFIVGISLVLSTRNGLNLTRYLRRLGVIAAAAAAITAATWIVFPDTFIFFGILHHIAVASVLGLLFLRIPIPVVIAAAVLCFVAPSLLAGPAFDWPALVWLGLSSTFPRTNDFVPLFPWFGIVLAGIGGTRLWLTRSASATPLSNRPGEGWAGRSGWPRDILLWAGRHSLAIYLAHQPLLFGTVFLAVQVYPPNLLEFEPQFIESCSVNCIDSEVDAEVCRKTCNCMAERSQAEGLWNDMMFQSLSAEDEQRYYDLADQCRAEAESP
jgi:uncharacterized membrane protein